MAVELVFFANLNRDQLSVSPAYHLPYQLPTLTSGDTVRLSVGVVADNPTSGQGALSRTNISGWSLKVAIGVEGSTPLTSATLSVGTDDDGLTVFEGALPMNVTAISDLFTGSPTSTFDKTFELEFNDGTGVQTLKRVVRLRNELISSSLTDPPAPDTALGKAEAANLYLKRGENPDGAGFILVSPDGTQKAYIYLDNQGQLQVSPLT